VKRRLSIAVVRQRFAQDGGAERFVARMLEALKGEDVQITLITREWESMPGVDVIKVDPFYIGRLWRDWSFSRAVCKLLKTRVFDLVQSHERIPCCDIYRAGDGVHREWLEQLGRVRGFFGRLMLAVNPYHLYVKWAEREMFTGQRIRAVICNSRMVGDEITRHFGLPTSKLHVIYNGVDTEQFNPRLRQLRAEIRRLHGIPDDAVLFLFVGSGFERKGVSQLLEALATLPAKTRLLVIGRDKKQTSYMRQAKRLGLAARVQFLGSQLDVKAYYGAAEALVLPTLYDPFPNVILEAMASGLPVITSNKSGGAELIEPSVDGWICDAHDAGDIAEGMQWILGVRDRTTLSRVIAQKAQKYDLERMAGEFLDLYKNESEL
jgi:UDP-glucose:(heptosyl)LPS alpha-1,3-glucosyltransferase